jgi:3-methylcrotonyl-CoA carboxylase alpha subunit
MRKVLIANRGEIACRVIKACRALDMATVAVYSEADESALHVEMADEARCIGPARVQESYLRGDAILETARSLGADGIHPGYGFLAENARFAEAVEEAGLTWVGPKGKTIEDMGDKERARLLAKAAGVPILPGSARFQSHDLDGLEQAAAFVGYPLLVKASAGGGGIGMQRVDGEDGLRKTVESTQSLAERAFGDGTVFLERFVAKARHVEVQVFGLGDGRVIHLFERDCSIQRRFQKIIEESPAPALAAETRAALAEAAVALAAQERFRGAGTVEFVVDAESGEFYFLEMNTRIQVEHPVTEMVTGQDLVALQLRLARGDDLTGLTQESIGTSGHAMEARIYAENPAKKFFPAPGEISRFDVPQDDPAVRVDTGVRAGDRITPFYDPMVAKVICHGTSREDAANRLSRTLRTIRLEGLTTNLEFLARVMEHDSFLAGDVHTGFVTQHLDALVPG